MTCAMLRRVGETEKVCGAGDVVAALERRFNPEGRMRQYATFTEVPNASERRRIDWLAVNVWLGRGREVHGVEIKVNRRDWQKELRQPKADEWYAVCDHWWLAAPQGVVQAGELPKPWGFLEMRRHGTGWKLFEKVKAPELEPLAEWPLWLVQRLLRRVDDRRMARPDEIVAMEERAYQMASDAFERGRQAGLNENRHESSAREELNSLVAALGGDDFRWRENEKRMVQIRRAISLLDTGRMEMVGRRTADMFREAAASIDAALPHDGGY